MSVGKALYHRAIPAAIRNPLGLVRREILDRIVRALNRRSVPPRAMLLRVQMTPWARDFLAVGSKSAQAIVETLAGAGIDPGKDARVLDFGCGCGRTIRHLETTQWTLSGCDIDGDAIRWCAGALAFATFAVNETEPPLPYGDGSFDAVYAVSVFTHLAPSAQADWRDELARILRPGGVAVISTMGPSILGNFPAIANPERLEQMRSGGHFFAPGADGFNSNAAFHSPGALVRVMEPRFALLGWNEQGLDGFQDLSVWQRV